MKFVTVMHNDIEKPGVLSECMENVFFLSDMGLTIPCDSVLQFIENSTETELSVVKNYIAGGTSGVSVHDVTLLSPIPKPPKDIICLGLNYMDHVEESSKAFNRNITERNDAVYFLKRTNRAVAPDGFIECHSDITDKLDYEVELGVVMWRSGRYIDKNNVNDYIFGYTIVNDMSARDLQQKHSQWAFAKSLDDFTPIGPYIVTKDEIGDAGNLNISSRINGELRQNSNTKNMIFPVDYVIEELSKGLSFVPGDIIATGTPSGVGMGFDPPKFLKAGDVVECEIEKIGILKNIIK